VVEGEQVLVDGMHACFFPDLFLMTIEKDLDLEKEAF
jgi:hypothetical protein